MQLVAQELFEKTEKCRRDFSTFPEALALPPLTRPVINNNEVLLSPVSLYSHLCFYKLIITCKSFYGVRKYTP